VDLFKAKVDKGERNVIVGLVKAGHATFADIDWLFKHRSVAIKPARVSVTSEGALIIIKVPDDPHGQAAGEVLSQLGNHLLPYRNHLTWGVNGGNSGDVGGKCPDAYVKIKRGYAPGFVNPHDGVSGGKIALCEVEVKHRGCKLSRKHIMELFNNGPELCLVITILFYDYDNGDRSAIAVSYERIAGVVQFRAAVDFGLDILHGPTNQSWRVDHGGALYAPPIGPANPVRAAAITIPRGCLWHGVRRPDGTLLPIPVNLLDLTIDLQLVWEMYFCD
jgi:hypothetical protein